jgi:hypothetical protein
LVHRENGESLLDGGLDGGDESLEFFDSERLNDFRLCQYSSFAVENAEPYCTALNPRTVTREAEDLLPQLLPLAASPLLTRYQLGVSLQQTLRDDCRGHIG